MADTATLNALIHGKQTAVSFRHLSTLLGVPTRDAQRLLSDYAASDPTLTALWCVTAPHPKTGVLRTSLTTSPPPDARGTIWAVGPPSAAAAPSPQAVWLAPDAARDRQLVAQPSHQRNELRDGRWARIRSPSCSWDERLDPRLGGDAALARGVQEKSTPTSLLTAVKAKAKGKKPKAKSSAFASGVFGGGSGAPTSSLFSSKPLGADAVRKIRAADKGKDEKEGKNGTTADVKAEPQPLVSQKEKKDVKKKPRKSEAKKKRSELPSAKKSRKIVDEDSDKEEHKRNPLDFDEEIDDEEEQMRELEREAAEKEKADAERAELEKELIELTRQHEEEPESPELKEVSEAELVDHGVESPQRTRDYSPGTPDSGKRKFWTTFGDAPSGAKRIRKEVEETVEETGYFVTRRVMKVFDENGNEVSDIEPEAKPVDRKTDAEDINKPRKIATPLKPKNAPSRKKDKSMLSSVKKEKGKDVQRPSSKLGGSTKKASKKKVKGNIMSYFGKKA